MYYTLIPCIDHRASKLVIYNNIIGYAGCTANTESQCSYVSNSNNIHWLVFVEHVGLCIWHAMIHSPNIETKPSDTFIFEILIRQKKKGY